MAATMNSPDVDFVIVDDDSLVLEMVTRKLKRSNVGLKCFADPELALDYLESHATRVLIVDQRMPRMDGLEMLLRLAERRWDSVGNVFLCSCIALSRENSGLANSVGAIELSKDVLRSESEMLELLNTESQSVN